MWLFAAYLVMQEIHKVGSVKLSENLEWNLSLAVIQTYDTLEESALVFNR